MCYAEVIGHCLHALERFFIFNSSKKNCWNMLCFNFRKAENITNFVVVIINNIINNRTSCRLIQSVIDNCMLDTSHFSLLLSNQLNSFLAVLTCSYKTSDFV